MAVSPGGLGTLLALIFIGPFIYLSLFLFKKFCRGNYGHAPPTAIIRPFPLATTEDDEEQREEMNSSQYLFALIGYAIGIGNVWRFPYVIANNGGSAALFAYIVCAIFVAVRYHMIC